MPNRGYIPLDPSSGGKDEFWMRNWFKQIKDFCFQTVHVKEIQTSDFTCRDSQFYPVNTAGGAVVATLPPALGIVGRRYTIKNYDGIAQVTVMPDGTDTIEGGASYLLGVQVISVTFV